jgi:anionic cell wall polymer biosynthesis LytR-Cps2A-Psr (LCP) family protein
LSQALGLYLGITIHHVAWIDLLGFASLIDTLGGVDVCLPGRIEDPTYGGPTWYPKVGIVLEAGCHHYDGVHALAYSRSRKGVMVMPDGSVIQQNDYLRAARQQEVLMALQGKLTAANLFTDLPGIMTAVGETVSTDIPRDQAGNLAALATSIDPALITRVVLGWPEYVDPPVDPLRNYLIIPRRDAIRQEMASLLGADEPLLGWYLGTTDMGPPAS